MAIQDGLLPLPVFMVTFLSGSRSPEFDDLSTLNMLCRVALDAYYASGLAPELSLIPANLPMTDILTIAQDAANLLRKTPTSPLSPFHQLNTTVSDLVIILLSCAKDLTQLTTDQAMAHFGAASEIFPFVGMTLRPLWEAHILNLSMLLGEDAKAAREAQMAHNRQFSLGKGDIVGPNSDTDIVSCGLLLNALVSKDIVSSTETDREQISRRASEFGSGDGLRVTAVLVAFIRWSSWSPHVFYSQILLASITGLAQAVSSDANTHNVMLWRAFVIGRVSGPH